MKRKMIRSLLALMLILSLSLGFTACARDRKSGTDGEPTAPPAEISASTPQPVLSAASSPILPEQPAADPTETAPVITPTPEPITVTLQYMGQEATSLAFMTSSVFQLQAVTSNGSTGGTWTSSDASSASVDENGVVTCWKAGTPKITYTQGDASASCALTITEPKVAIYFAGQAKTDITLNSVWGFEIQLVSVVNPEGSVVSWSSDDSSIASVNETGKVVAHKMGSTQIHAKCGTADAACWIRVMENPPQYLAATPDPADNTPRILITYAGVPNTDLTMTVGSTLSMGYTLYNIDPSTAKVTWSISDPAYASVDKNGVLVAIKSTFGPIPGRNYTILKATCGNYSCECMVFIKANG